MRILFVPHTEYHVVNMSACVGELETRGFECVFVNIEKVYRNEGVGEALERLGLKYVEYEADIVSRARPRAVIVMNDWGGVVQTLVREANDLKIPTIGIIEGVQDFLDSHVEHIGVGRIRRPYRTVKHVLAGGDYDLKFVDRDKAFVVGMPRIEPLFKKDFALPESIQVAINCNFTYGIYTDFAERWVLDAVEACRSLGVDYVVTRHHADTTNLSGLKVARAPLHEVLSCSRVFVSRFSTAILEAMAMGRPVVYYNPHGERVDTFKDSMGAFETVVAREELCSAIENGIRRGAECKERSADFLRYHVSVTDEAASKRTASAIAQIIESMEKQMEVTRSHVAVKDVSDSAKANIEWNCMRWGTRDGWVRRDKYGYQWGGGVQQRFNAIVDVCERFLLPYVEGRRDLVVLEIAPGAGRFTTELVRIAKQLYLLDMNEACIEMCRERFKYYENIVYLVNDGVSCEMLPGGKFDLVASFDSFVHIEREVIQAYLMQLFWKVKAGGVVWIDHSGKGRREVGHRTDMTAEAMGVMARDAGFEVIAQHFRNEHDCISVLRSVGSAGGARVAIGASDAVKNACGEGRGQRKCSWRQGKWFWRIGVVGGKVAARLRSIGELLGEMIRWLRGWRGFGMSVCFIVLVMGLMQSGIASFSIVAGIVMGYGWVVYVGARSRRDAREARESLAKDVAREERARDRGDEELRRIVIESRGKVGKLEKDVMGSHGEFRNLDGRIRSAEGRIGEVVKSVQILEKGFKGLRDAMGRKGYQGFRRKLDSEQTHCLLNVAQTFRIKIGEAGIQYMAHRISFLEDLCRGRLACSVEDAILRVLGGRMKGGACIEVLEIGVLFGVGAVVLYDLLAPYYESVALTLVDRFDGYYGEGLDVSTGMPVSLAETEGNLRRALVPDAAVRIVQGASGDEGVVGVVGDREYDVVIIDGDHSYDCVKRDFTCYSNSVRKGGLIVFDDYDNKQWPDVSAFVDREVCGRSDFVRICCLFHTAVFVRV